MMPVQDVVIQSGGQNASNPAPSVSMPTAHGEGVNYKKKYKVLKRKMTMLVYEQECFMEELKKAQRKLLKVSRDRTFLMDRLLQYEKLDDTSDDTDATATSDSEGEGVKEPAIKKKKVPNQTPLTLPGSGVSLLPPNLSKQASLLIGGSDKSVKGEAGAKRKTPKVNRKAGKAGSSASETVQGPPGVGTMTREELERHLELKQSAKPQFMSLDALQTSYSLPDDIFSHDNSNQDGEMLMEIKKEEPASFIIHMPR